MRNLVLSVFTITSILLMLDGPGSPAFAANEKTPEQILTDMGYEEIY